MLDFIAAQLIPPRGGVDVQIDDLEKGLSARAPSRATRDTVGALRLLRCPQPGHHQPSPTGLGVQRRFEALGLRLTDIGLADRRATIIKAKAAGAVDHLQRDTASTPCVTGVRNLLAVRDSPTAPETRALPEEPSSVSVAANEGQLRRGAARAQILHLCNMTVSCHSDGAHAFAPHLVAQLGQKAHRRVIRVSE